MEQIKEEPQFKINDKVNRMQEEEPKGAIIIEIISLSEWTYKILYDEKDFDGNDIYGWWPESSLEFQ